MEQISIGQRSRVKYKGTYDAMDWYRKLFDIFVTMGYTVDETKYREVRSPDGESRDILLSWEAKKNYKQDSYVQFYIRVDCNLIALKRKEVVVNGEKVKMDSGDNDCYYYGYIILDPKDKWQNSGFLRYLRYLYDRFFYRSKIEFYKNMCYEEMYTITNEIKAYFNMQRFM
jgi:hypothetical protein